MLCIQHLIPLTYHFILFNAGFRQFPSASVCVCTRGVLYENELYILVREDEMLFFSVGSMLIYLLAKWFLPRRHIISTDELIICVCIRQPRSHLSDQTADAPQFFEDARVQILLATPMVCHIRYIQSSVIKQGSQSITTILSSIITQCNRRSPFCYILAYGYQQ